MLVSITFLIVGRLVYLTFIKSSFLKNQGHIRTGRNLVIPTQRGLIKDRNGEMLAVNKPKLAIWIDPKVFNPACEQLKKLSMLIGTPTKTIKQQCSQSAKKRFMYLKREVSIDQYQSIKELNINGLFANTEYRRYYPHGEVMAPLIGFTDIDNQGQDGLEMAYNCWLKGKSGMKRIVQNRLGKTISEPIFIVPLQPGKDIQLSLDYRIQYTAFRALAAGVDKYQAKSGSTIVLDATTGEVLAMVNYPSYDPNQNISHFSLNHRNRAVTDTFEPGSTLKPLSLISVLESGKFTLESLIDTSPGKLLVNNHWIKDHRDYKLINLEKILQVSSNVGMAKLVLSMPSHNLLSLFKKLGLGEITQSGFPGERSGFLPTESLWEPFTLAALSFGYGVSVTGLQLAQAYAVLANRGYYVPVTFLKQTKSQSGQPVINSKVSQTILEMLESVLTKEGTAPLANVKGYRISGKTGTTRIVDTQGYSKDRHNSFFIGVAPTHKPRLVVLVILNDIRSQHYYGGSTASLIFSKTVVHALRILSILPN